MNSFKQEEVQYVASLSAKYLAEENDCKANDSGKSKNSLKALLYGIRSDLLPMLIATEQRIDRLPIVYLAEANA